MLYLGNMKLKKIILFLYFLGLIQAQVAPYIKPLTENRTNYHNEALKIKSFDDVNKDCLDLGKEFNISLAPSVKN